LWLLLAAATFCGCRGEAGRSTGVRAATAHAGGKAWFRNVLERSGVDFRHQSGQTGKFLFPEIIGGGACLLDYDGDGLLDLYLVQSGSLEATSGEAPGNKLYRNTGSLTFEDATASAGVGDTGYGMGCAAGDYDNDGDADLFVTNVGPDVLYRNNGDGTFADVSVSSGVTSDAWGCSAAFVDYDGDGDLDLFTVNYVTWSARHELECFSRSGRRDYCQPANYHAPARDTLYRNNGDGTFSDVSEEAGLGAAFGYGLGVVCGDFNRDGRTDVYVANDGTANQLWINAGGGKLTDEALLAGCAVNMHGGCEAGMGVQAVDVDPDGHLDLFVSHLRNETNTLYRNLGEPNAGVFEDATARTGLAASSLPYTGFGLGFADFDHDGLLDLYVANGRVMLAEPNLDEHDPYAEPNLLYRGTAGGRFDEILPKGGTAEALVHTSRGTALGDLDNDGDFDLVVVNRDAAPYLLDNMIGVGNGRWILFDVQNAHGAPAVGAELVITVGEKRWLRRVDPHYGYLGSNDPRVHVGLGEHERVEQVQVRWADGAIQTFGPLAAGRVHRLRPGAPRS